MSRPAIPGEPARSAFMKFLISFRYAARGLWFTSRTQRNMRIQLGAAVLVIVAGLLLHISAIDFAILTLAISGVLVTEMFNTACELCVDLAQPNYHPLAGAAKDVAAGAVLLSAIMAVVVGLLVLGPPLWRVLFQG
jgi:diacylglycerol kinase